jgi:hypothetical protein
MKTYFAGLVVCALATAGLGVSAAMGEVIWHDPWLNWDFDNLTGQTVNDFEIVVEDPNYSPDPDDPTEVLKNMPFPNFTVSHVDYHGDNDIDTVLTWSGADLLANQRAHGGLYMLGSGRVLDAYWTFDGVKVGNSTAITYERTEIRGDPEVHMHLNIAPGFFADTSHPEYPHQEAGWTNIRTFVNLPAGLLDLEDLNRSLNLDDLYQYEVDPKNGLTGEVILRTDTILAGGPDSFFDVFLSEILPQFVSPGYEALLHAEVFNQSTGLIGEFWNLNPQSPEPGTLALIGLGSTLLLRRRRR